MTTDIQHSISRHPLREMLTEDEWKQLCVDVQFVRMSWPLLVEIRRDEEASAVPQSHAVS
jgi:hypothetical protein